MNSINAELAAELHHALLDASANNTVRVVLLTGEGRAFCAGQDLDEVDPKRNEQFSVGDVIRDRYNPLARQLYSINKPTVCAVNGVAAGAGAIIALSCDFVLASQNAKFIQSFCNIGLIPDTGGSHILPRLVGMAQAKAMCILGTPVSAHDAKTLGMIYDTYPQDQLLVKASELTKLLAAKPTSSIGLTKKALNESFVNSFDEQLQLEEKLQREAAATDDFKEGINAFFEKRDACFKGQ